MKPIALADAVALIPDGASLMVGGFMGVGTPERLCDGLVRQGKRDLTVIANDNTLPGVGIGKLVAAGLVRRTIASHIGLNPDTQKGMIEGLIKVELVPHGTLVERIRADFALVHARAADYLGNLHHALTARNCNPIVAMAGAAVFGAF